MPMVNPCELARQSWLLSVATIAVAGTPIRWLPAQGRVAPPIEIAVEEQTRDRWMHGRQRPRFTRFVSARTWLLADSLRANGGGEQRLYLTLGRSAAGRDSAI